MEIEIIKHENNPVSVTEPERTSLIFSSGDRHHEVMFLDADKKFDIVQKLIALAHGINADLDFMPEDKEQRVTPIRFRPQRGSFEESMQKMTTHHDAQSLLLCIHENWASYFPSPFRVRSKEVVFDDRPGWNSKTFLVSVNGQAVGFSDAPVSGDWTDAIKDI